MFSCSDLRKEWNKKLSIKFCFKCGKTASESFQMMYKPHIVCLSRRCLSGFPILKGRESPDDPRERRSSTSTSEKKHALVRKSATKHQNDD